MAARQFRLFWIVLLAAGSVAADEPARPRLDRGGFALPERALVRLGATHFRPGGQVASVAFAPDGKSLASLGRDGISFWNAADGKCLKTLQPGAGGEGRIEYACAGRVLLVTGDFEKNVEHADSFPKIQCLFDPLTPIRRFAVSPDRTRVALLCGSNVTVLDIASGVKVAEWKNAGADVDAIAYSPDGTTLLAGGKDHVFRFWSINSGKVVRRAMTDLEIDGIEYLPDGSHFVVAHRFGFSSHRLELFETTSGKSVRHLFNNPARALAISPNGRYLAAAGGHDGKLRVFDFSDPDKYVFVDAHRASVNSLCFSPDSKWLATAGDDSTIRVWDPATGAPRSEGLDQHRAPIRCVTFLPDNRSIVTGGDDETVRFWDVSTGASTRQPLKTESAVSSLKLLGPKRIGIVAHRLQMLDIANPVWRAPDLDSMLKQPTFRVSAFSQNGDFVIGSDLDEALVLNTATSKELARIAKQNCIVTALAVDSLGKCAAIGFYGIAANPQVEIWDVSANRINHTLDLSGTSVSALALVEEGRLLATGDDQGRLCLWDVTTGRLANEWTVPDVGIASIHHEPNSRTIAAGCDDGSVVVWERRTGLVRHHFHGHRGHIRAIQFSSDGRLLASGSDDTTALIWSMAPIAAEKPPTQDDYKRMWEDLMSNDGGQAERGIWRLANGGKMAVDFLRQQLPAATGIDAAQVARLIDDLDHSQFSVRQKAEQELAQFGDAAKAALVAARGDKISVERRERIGSLLDRLDETPQGESLRELRAIEALERHGSPEARMLLGSIAAGAPGRLRTQEAKTTLAKMAENHRQERR